MSEAATLSLEKSVSKPDPQSVTITVTDTTCSVDPCALKASRGQEVSFVLDNQSSNLKNVKAVVITKGPLFRRHGVGRRTFTLSQKDVGKGKKFRIEGKSALGKHEYSVTASYQKGESTSAECDAVAQDEALRSSSDPPPSRSVPYVIIEE